MTLICFTLLIFPYPWILTPMSSYRNPFKVVWHKFICRYIYPWYIYSPLIFNVALTLQTLPAGPGSCLWPPSQLGFWSGLRPPGFKPERSPLALRVFWHSQAYSGKSPRLFLVTGYFTKAIFFLSRCWRLFQNSMKQFYLLPFLFHFWKGQREGRKIESKMELPEGISVIGGELGELELVQRKAESWFKSWMDWFMTKDEKN